MWDEVFDIQYPETQKIIKKAVVMRAYALIDQIFDPVWDEIFRVLRMVKLLTSSLAMQRENQEGYKYLEEQWGNFPDRIEQSAWIFGLAGVTALLITWITVGYQSTIVATANPAESLRAK